MSPREERLGLNVFGRDLLAVRSEDRGQLFYTGAQGKRRLATDIVVEEGLSGE